MDSKKVFATGFSRWLFQRRDENSPTGDLASDAYNDDRWPRTAQTIERFESYLSWRRACDGAYKALLEAWVQYKKRDMANNDWMNQVYTISDCYDYQPSIQERQQERNLVTKSFYFGVEAAINFLQAGGTRRQLKRYCNWDAFDCAYGTNDVSNKPHFYVCDYPVASLPVPWKEIRKQIFSRDGTDCYYCGAKDSTHVDHVVPWSKGGTDDKDNLVVACAKCNFEKWTKTKDEFLKQRNAP